jgi:hypothetical protein
MDYQNEYNQMMNKDKTPTTEGQERFRYIIIAIVAFILGFGSAWLSFKSQDGQTVVENEGEGMEEVEDTLAVALGDNGENTEGGGSGAVTGGEPETISIGNVSLGVKDQAPGKSIFVEEVSAEKPVWVVVIENVNGEKGNVIGAGLFDVDESAGVVNLLRGTVAGGEYYAAMYNEDSNLAEGRTFDLEKDVPLVDLEGNAIEVLFKTTTLPE